MDNRISLVLADDHTMFRVGLRRLLEESRGYQVVGEAATGREAIEVARQTKPTAILMDYAMPDLNGAEATDRLRHDVPETKVVMLSMHRHESYVLQALQSGASGYVVKDSAFQDLITALETIRHGQIYVSPSACTPRVKNVLAHREPPPATTNWVQQLTPRERQCCRLIVEGKSTKAIADELGISVKTAETHRAHLMRKLHVHNVAELVRAAVQSGLSEL